MEREKEKGFIVDDNYSIVGKYEQKNKHYFYFEIDGTSDFGTRKKLIEKIKKLHLHLEPVFD